MTTNSLTISEVLPRVLEVSRKDQKNLITKSLKLTEEAGEVAGAVLSYTNTNGCGYKRKTKTDVLEEIADTILVALATADILCDGNLDENELSKMLLKKASKLESILTQNTINNSKSLDTAPKMSSTSRSELYDRISSGLGSQLVPGLANSYVPVGLYTDTKLLVDYYKELSQYLTSIDTNIKFMGLITDSPQMYSERGSYSFHILLLDVVPPNYNVNDLSAVMYSLFTKVFPRSYKLLAMEEYSVDSDDKDSQYRVVYDSKIIVAPGVV